MKRLKTAILAAFTLATALLVGACLPDAPYTPPVLVTATLQDGSGGGGLTDSTPLVAPYTDPVSFYRGVYYECLVQNSDTTGDIYQICMSQIEQYKKIHADKIPLPGMDAPAAPTPTKISLSVTPTRMVTNTPRPPTPTNLPVSVTNTPVPSTLTPAFYLVQKGDSLGVIAIRAHLTVTQLLQLNPQITNPNVISIGQRIRIK